MPATRVKASPSGAGSPTSRVRGRDLRLLPVAGAVWLCAMTAAWLPAAAGAIAGILWVVAALAGTWAVAVLGSGRGRGPAAPSHRVLLSIPTFLPLIAVGAALSAATATHVALLQPARAAATAAVADGQTFVRLTATVTGKVREVGGMLWMDAEAGELRAGAETLSAPVPVTVAVDPGAVSGELLDLGSVIEAHGTARPGESGQRAVLVLFAGRLETVTAPAAALALASSVRDGFVTEVVKGLPEPGGGLLPGLAVGDTRAVSEELDAAMKASALAHLVAVSGSNCLIVTGIVYALASSAMLPRWARSVAAGAGLLGFVVLVTPEPSVVRAGAMALIGMTAMLLGRAGGGCAVLSLAVVVLLTADPLLATSYGFVLSAGATAALLLLAGPLAEGLSRRMPRLLALAIAVPLSAQLVCGPVIVLLAPEAALYGVVANLIAAPAAPVATVVGLLACLLQGVPILAQGLAAIAWVPSAWIAQTALLFAGLPGARLPWWGGLAGAAALALVGACIAVIVIVPRAGPAPEDADESRGRRPRRGPRGAGPRCRVRSARQALRTTAVLLLAIATGVGAGSAMLGGVAAPLTVPREWSIAMCDIGQGDAVVLRSAGAVALIDTGPEPERLDACLARLGVQEIDLLVVTHFDLDHVGGIGALAGRVATALHGPLGEDDESWLATLGDARVTEASAGMSGSLGDARWRVLWPTGSRAVPEGNDASVVVEFAGGGVPGILLLGDLSSAAQSALRATGALAPEYPVVKVSHHGSADQQPALYREIRPVLALIGVGADNSYGHPAESILAELSGAGASVARTDEDGLVLVGAEDGILWTWRERSPPGGTGENGGERGSGDGGVGGRG